MTAFYKIVENGFVTGVGTNGNDEVTEIMEAQYLEILSVIHNKPTAEEGYAYLLRDDTLEWELVELTPEPEEEIDPNEALKILFGDSN